MVKLANHQFSPLLFNIQLPLSGHLPMFISLMFSAQWYTKFTGLATTATIPESILVCVYPVLTSTPMY